MPQVQRRRLDTEACRTMSSPKRVCLRVVAAIPFVLIPCFGQADQESAQLAAGATISDIQLSFKRDPRAVDSFRGIGPWAPGPSYGGSTAQDTVEARAE